MPYTFTLEPVGDYDLRAAIRFLEGWPPTAGLEGRVAQLDWSAHLGEDWTPVAVSVTQRANRLEGRYRGDVATKVIADYAARVLSVDVDGTGMMAVARRDPVAAALIESNPGLRPVCFWSPYEAAAWGVISPRSSMVQASRLMRGMADALGEDIGDRRTFPSPGALLRLDSFPGLSQTKIERLHNVARAAVEGSLEAEHLRSMETEEALASLQDIEGVGPFTAELILVRGAGHPDVFPKNERRLHALMRTAYGRPEAPIEELNQIALAWHPYRSWVGFQFRSSGA